MCGVGYASIFYNFRGVTCKHLNNIFLSLLLVYFPLGLLIAAFCLSLFPSCAAGASLAGVVLSLYSSMLRCFVGVLYCVGFNVRCCSLPSCLMGCLPLLCDFFFVAIGVEVLCVYGVCQIDTIFGWSTRSGCLLPWEYSLFLASDAAFVQQFFIFLPCALLELLVSSHRFESALF